LDVSCVLVFDLTGTNPQKTRIRSVSKASQILLLLADMSDGMTATEVAEALRLPTPTAHHLLNTLVDETMLAKDGRRYSLGLGVGALAEGFLRRMAPPSFLVGPLYELADRTGETCYMNGWRGGEIAVLLVVEGTHPVRVSGIHPGFAESAHARASGKLLLSLVDEDIRRRYLQRHPLRPITPHTIVDEDELESAMAQAREVGYAEEIEEFRAGVACMSAPAINGSAASIAFTVATPLDRFRRAQQELLGALLSVTRSLSDGSASR
jgi:IclR family acetate operon transcriptional repressor